ncbi:MAG: FAD-dependent oxidoreductase, partial [Anaerolineales bacterium]
MSEKVGVYICHCGTNIAGTVDVEEVARWAGEQPNVEIARDYKFMCSSLGQDLIEEDIKEKGLTRVVVASCSPHMHEKTFRTACERAGLNPFLFEMANIREHDSWTTDDKEAATLKAKALVMAAVDRVVNHESLEPLPVEINPNTLIVGAGIAGISAALELANGGFHVYLVEREPSIGGHMAQLDKTFPTLDCSACILTPKMVEVGQHPNITLLTWSEVENVAGYLGNFTVTVRKKARYVNEETCTGCGICYNQCPRTITDPIQLMGEFKSGYVANTNIPEVIGGQDGGTVTSLLAYLFDEHLIDAAIVTMKDPKDPWHPIAQIVTNKDDAIKASGSIYTHSQTVEALMDAIRQDFRSIAFVGTPCNIDAVDKMMNSPSGMLKYFMRAHILKIGLFCMDSFSAEALYSFFREEGIDMKKVKKMDINKGKFHIYYESNQEPVKSYTIKELDKFKSSSCNFCTDLTAENADISVGSVGSGP